MFPVAEGMLDPRRALPLAIGPYEVIERLGEGGVGVVYRARHRNTGEVVALKTVRATRAANLSSVRREIRALQRLRHPGIVAILEGGVHDGRPWCAMELLSGQALDKALAAMAQPRLDGAGPRFASPDSTTAEGVPPSAYVAASGEMEPADPGARRPLAAARLAEVLTLVRRLCVPLGFLHGEGLVHRDLKPSNVFVRPDGTPVLMDFGLAGRRHGALGREVLEEAAAFMGTVGYMAPEQVRGEIQDARTDLYALGCLLFEALTGRLPFEGNSNGEVMMQHLSRSPPLPSRLVSGVPPELEDVIVRLLAKSPRDRIGHVGDVARRLAALGAQGWPGGDPVRPRAYLYQPRLVGRAAVLDEVVGALGPWRPGARYARGSWPDEPGAVVLIGGESGIGKTSLAAEAARLAHQDGLDVVTGDCLPPSGEAGEPERGSPLHPFRLLFQRIAERCVAGGPAATARLLGRHRRLLAATEPVLVQAPFDDSYPEPPPLPPQAARERLLEALAETITAVAAARPLLLVVDDVQWADDLSLALLGLLGRRLATESTRQLMVLGTYRSEEVSGALQALFEQPGVRRTVLGRLDDRDVGTIVADMLGQPQPPADLARFVARESEGNPFFVAEYLRTALAEGMIFRDEQGRWQRDEGATQVAALALPHTLRALVERRLASLSTEARALVEVAAVIGRELEPDLLSAVAGRAFAMQVAADEGAPGATGAGGDEQVLAATNDLLARQIFTETPTGRLAFVHDKLREIAYDATAADRKRSLHGMTAEALEGRHAGNPEIAFVYGSLAHHHRHGGELSRAVEYLEKAGLHSLERSANGDAVAYFEEALRLDDEAKLGADSLRRARWERLAGEAMQGLGNLSASKDHLRRAVALLGAPEPRSRAGLALRVLAAVARQVWHRLRPGGPARRPVDSAVLLEAARAYDRLFQVYYFEAAPLPLFHANLATLNLAERAHPSPELASAYANAFGALSLVAPLRGLAAGYLRRAEQTLARVADPAVESYLELLRGVILSGAGSWSAAEERLRRVVAIANELGYRRRWEEATGVLAYNRLLTGAVDEALASADAVYHSAARGDRQTQCWSLLERAQAKLALGLLEDAAVDARNAERLSDALGRDERIWTQGTLALAAFRRGDRAAARAAAERALAAISAGSPVMSACVEAYAAVAEVLLALWEAEPAGDGRRDLGALARRACRALAGFARVFPFARPRADLRRGDLHWACGHPRRAGAWWRRARAAARSLGMPADEGLAVLRLGEHAAPGPERAALVEEAAALLARGGQRHLAAQARKRVTS